MFAWASDGKDDKEMAVEPKVKKEKKEVKRPVGAVKKKKSAKKGSGSSSKKMDISSGEEDTAKTSRVRQKKPKRVRDPVVLGSASALPVVTVKLELEGMPILRSLDHFAADNPHINTDPSASTPCVGVSLGSGAGSGSGSGSGVKAEVKQKEKDHKAEAQLLPASRAENPLARPFESQQLQARLDRLPVIQPIVKEQTSWDRAQSMQALRQGYKLLPLFTAAYESELLAAAGTYRHTNGRTYTFPQCPQKDKCVGLLGDVLYESKDGKDGVPFKHILMASMLPADYETFLRTGEEPKFKFNCIGCIRCAVIEFVVSLRGSRVMNADSKEQFDFVLEPDTLLQPYRNMADCEGGYYGEHMLDAKDDPWEGLVSRMAMFSASMLVGRKTPQGRPFIDQSALVWKMGVAERVGLGESIADFSSGVAN